ncbi:MarR family winged helix-turn-helix transcriptional regulator [Cognatiyoonia sp. IB215182]|uniref:MarR family winged helix-turn-helix transcriptional regulator n=1 Tax=Cognatiyoonia sp. IB215182 TaxID=3097353 RepID=UPI002A14AE3B|nr:MarR family winged helix-turn-helix transcriptional regulator [Cognatiyoonia sp. IB215182]MDX8353680.1 MarR family winged helix-turn-helix transcriptional regulator [Cognatiyoonia sp. IB215182]
MVKKVDELAPDHIGWRLWNASKQWETRFAAAMIDAGFSWYGDARAGVIPYISASGTRQVDIVNRMQISKQAVHQSLSELEMDGVIRRVPDPDDGRGRIVQFTERGVAARKAALKIKEALENDLRAELGEVQFDALYASLGAFLPKEDR